MTVSGETSPSETISTAPSGDCASSSQSMVAGDQPNSADSSGALSTRPEAAVRSTSKPASRSSARSPSEAEVPTSARTASQSVKV